MDPLNQELYKALQQFGEVHIVDAGVELLAEYHADHNGRVRMHALSPGEYYCINCPYCTDMKFRLWINHRWGIRDVKTGTRNRWLAICYNENCLASEQNRLDL